MIAMLVSGPIILVGFIFYESFYAMMPVFPLRLFKNRTVVAAALIGQLNWLSLLRARIDNYAQASSTLCHFVRSRQLRLDPLADPFVRSPADLQFSEPPDAVPQSALILTPIHFQPISILSFRSCTVIGA